MNCEANCHLDKEESGRKVFRDFSGKIVWKYVGSHNLPKGMLLLRKFNSCLCGCGGIKATPSPHMKIVYTDKNKTLNNEQAFEELQLADKPEPTSKKPNYKGDTKVLYELRAKMSPESLAKVNAKSMQMLLEIHREELIEKLTEEDL